MIQNNKVKNMDIVGATEYFHGTDPAWLETTSPHNRQFIEDAYRNYNTQEINRYSDHDGAEDGAHNSKK